VAGTNLTRAEAVERASLLDVDSYDIAIDLTDGGGKPGDRTFRSRTEVRFRCSRPGEGTFVDVIAESLGDITLNGTPVDTTGYDPEQGVHLTGLAAENVLIVEAEYKYMNSGEGMSRFADPVDGEVYLHSQFEAAEAKRVYACFDQPDLKATYTWHATAPAHWQVVSNAAVEDVTDGEGGARTHHFARTVRMSPYVTALVAGPYHVVTDHHDGIDLGLYCRQSLKQYLDADNLFQVTKQGFDWYHAQFGYRYPFGKYDQLFVPEFAAGAMENAGCVTILEDYVFRSRPVAYMVERRAETLLHEMAHMWFGDLVTMRWWDDLWLNESFATFISFLCMTEATEWPDAWVAFENIEKSWGYRQDQLPSTHPIAADIPDVHAVEVNFDGITYAKGAAVLRQLMAYVGRDAFMKGMQEYFRRYEFGNARLADLLAVLEATSGRNLTDWSRRWLQTAQVNTIRPDVALGADGTMESVALLQEAPTEHPTLRPHRLAVGLYDVADGTLTLRRRVELDVDGPRTEVGDLAGEKKPDLLLVNDSGLTYTKVRLDPTSVATVVERLHTLDDALARALCWQATWDMVRDAEMPAREYVRLVLSALPGETASSGNLDTLRNTRAALERYTDPSWSPEGWARLAETAYAVMRSADPSSDPQLQWARMFASAARTPEHLDSVAGLLDGSYTIDGLVVDTDLRWHLLGCLVATGRAGDAEIDAELERDATASGQRQAATARSLRPTAEAKAEAWEKLVTDSGLPNAVNEAIVRGFFHPLHLELTQPYAARYFEAVADVWKSRTNEVGQTFAIGMFPASHVSDETVQAADEWLADSSHPPALRRLVSEGRAGLIRALRARETDSASG
jgi:aminopeptidase N